MASWLSHLSLMAFQASDCNRHRSGWFADVLAGDTPRTASGLRSFVLSRLDYAIHFFRRRQRMLFLNSRDFILA